MRLIRHASPRPSAQLAPNQQPGMSTVHGPQTAATSPPPQSGRVQTYERVKHVRELSGQDRVSGQDLSRTGAPQGLAGLRYEAWNWAQANRTGDGALPPGRVIAQRFGRSERWGRLVKNAGAAGQSSKPAPSTELVTADATQTGYA